MTLMFAGRLGSPIISIFSVGVWPKFFVTLMENSLEGGGAIERGMLAMLTMLTMFVVC